MQKMIRSFLVSSSAFVRALNMDADTIATLASKIDIPNEAILCKIVKKALSAYLIPAHPIDEQD